MSLEGSQIGRFHLQRLLGRGGMGEVYLAEDDQLRRQVAIKVIQADYQDPNATRLFLREARAIAMLNHPHILPLFDFGEATLYGAVLTYMVMPFCKDGTLVAWMQQHRNPALLSLQDIGDIIQQAASALQYAHNHQIVHQDVKPSNFLIRSYEDASGRPDLMLADFGVAKSTSATATVSQTVRGTPAYMAPEQWDGTPVPATDQYALAILAYDLLTGHPPFQGSLGQVMYQHIHVTPPPPRTLNPRIPTDVDTVLLHALAKKPEERFGSISAFARAFEQALSANNASPIRANTQYEQVRSDIHTPVIAIASPGEQALPSNINSDATVANGDPVTDSKGAGEIAPMRSSERMHTPASPVTGSKGPAEIASPPGPSISTEISPRHRGLSRGIAILLVGLALLVILGGVGFFYFTRSAQQNPYPPFGTLALDDPLSDNSHGFNWLDVGGGAGSCAFTGGAYHVSALQQGSNHYCIASPNFSDSAFQVQMTIVKGDAGAIGFRSDSTKGNGYLFVISQDGKYGLYRFTNATPTLLRSGSNTAINTGLNQSNIVAVVASGSTIDLYVNNQKIDSVSDSTYSQGQIGVSALDLNNPTEVVFSNAKVWT